MKISTIIIILVLILALYYYTAETFEVVETVGEHIYELVVNTGNAVIDTRDDLKEKDTQGKFDRFKQDIEKLLNKIKN